MIIAIFDKVADPLTQRFTNDSIDHVDYELPRQTRDVPIFWEVVVDSLNLPPKLQYGLNSQAFVHWNVKNLNIFGFDN